MADKSTPSSLARYLDGEFWETKDHIREEISQGEPFRTSSYGLTLDQNRDLTVERLEYILTRPLMRHHLKDQMKEKQPGFIAKSLGITELICSADMSTGVKLGVVCGLFGGAVTNLGSPEQKKTWYLPVTDSEFTGMFAMTERGHGSNVRGILTEACYEPSTQEFIIHTPCEDAQKMYIGNSMKGITPPCSLSSSSMEIPKVLTVSLSQSETDMELTRVDNGILIFDNVRIPRKNLLSKFGCVSADGLYSSPVQNKSKRFNAMLAALTPTRLGLTVQAMAAMKLGLIIAVRYSHRYRTFTS
ncbi:hypothetical protein J4Q44_G00360640 [Coregonus suidteri]|uniref:Uncharacterized protein n=1 Tax=Coregonus suidteri TaxID=861788 RepID=A0AAN8KLJ4_9TELE